MNAARLSILSRSVEATEALGRRLGECADAGCVLALDGDLGAGKTCLVRGLAAGLGARDRVSSPSFVLHVSYPGRLVLHHLDAYFRERAVAFIEEGGYEYLAADGVCAVEWARTIETHLPADRLDLQIEHLAEEERRLAFTALGPRAGSWLRALAERVRGEFPADG